MCLLSVKARVSLPTEHEIDRSIAGLSIDEPSVDTYWRKISIHCDEIKRIIQFDREKTIIKTWDDDTIFVKEPHKIIHEKWKVALNEKINNDIDDINNSIDDIEDEE